MSEQSEDTTALDETLLSLLGCPACDDRPPLRQEGNWLVCDACARRYPIRDGLPEVLVESAVLNGSDE
jgi:uncharacterized protein YbaR (Trm112 family)